MLTKAKIQDELKKAGVLPPKILFYDITDSTNTRAKEYAKENPHGREPVVFIANEQTAGRGRRGRSFVSRPGAGIYVSILTYPEESAADATRSTAKAAVQLARAIESLCDCKIGIKWVNDLYLGDKKLAGILTEGELNIEGIIAYQVIGMGINVYRNAISDEIKDIATSLEHHTTAVPDRARLAAMIIKEMLCSDGDFLAEYRARSIVTGRNVTIQKLDKQYRAKVIEINEDFSLTVEREDGSREKLFTGEISLKI